MKHPAIALTLTVPASIAAFLLVIASAGVSANTNAFDNDYYEDNLRPSEINTNVDMKVRGDHFERMVKQSDMVKNVPILSEDAAAYDNDEYGDDAS